MVATQHNSSSASSNSAKGFSGQSNFIRYKKDNPCPVCEGVDGKCGSYADSGAKLVFCHVERADRNGYKHLGASKNGYWHKFIRKDDSDRSYSDNGHKTSNGRSEPRRTEGAKDSAVRIKPEFEEPAADKSEPKPEYSAVDANLLRRFQNDVARLERNPPTRASCARSILDLPVACMDAMPIGVVAHKIMGYPTLAMPQYRADGILQTVQFIGLAWNPETKQEQRRKSNLEGCGSALFLPINQQRTCHIVPVVEGVRDVLALFLMGIWAIGTLSAGAGADHLAEWAKRNPDARLALVIENDKKKDGRWPSMEGRLAIAARLKKLGVSCSLVKNPEGFKDVTDCYQGSYKLSYDYFVHYCESFVRQSDFTFPKCNNYNDLGNEFPRHSIEDVSNRMARKPIPQTVETKEVTKCEDTLPHKVTKRLPKIAISEPGFCLRVKKKDMVRRPNEKHPDGEWFRGRPACNVSGCPECMPTWLQQWADDLNFGMSTIASETWHVSTNHHPGQWRNNLYDDVKNADHYARLVFESRMLVLCTNPFPGSVPMAEPDAWQEVTDFFPIFEPNIYDSPIHHKSREDGKFTHSITADKAWPKEPKKKKEKNCMLIGESKASEEERAEVYRRRGISESYWQKPPKSFADACTLIFGTELKWFDYKAIFDEFKIDIKLQWKKDENDKPIRDSEGGKIRETKAEAITRILRFKGVKLPEFVYESVFPIFRCVSIKTMMERLLKESEYIDEFAEETL